MKSILIFIMTLGLFIFASNCNSVSQESNSKQSETKQDKPVNKDGQVVSMTNETFKQLVFDYHANKEWKFAGNKPVIIDFYANWCGPCRQLSPRIEEIAKEYAGKIDVYKVDTDVEVELAQNMGITSLPTLIFIPVKGQPQATMGALPKADLIKIIDEVLMVNEPVSKTL